MLSDELKESLNSQVNEELYSAYLYAAVAGYFESINLKGFAHWMNLQVAEELSHAAKIVDYLFQRGAHVIYKAIAEPPAD